MGKTANQIGKRIRALRNQKKLSQVKLAELSGLHESYIGQIERGEKNVSVEMAAKVAKGLNIPLSRLVEVLDDAADPAEDIPLKCYELVAEKSPDEQKRLYLLLMEIEKYKNS
ncbi:MAG: helix-turn-helix domain-containing protein [Clostridia bacterium]|jgi:transcriptional regulator with XRE-family HTH domain|nr:helix-turn-helix domain-containing protein [Clostridia bacterium]